MFILIGDRGYPGPPGLRGQKGNLYIVLKLAIARNVRGYINMVLCLGDKGDSGQRGDPGDRGPRGLVGLFTLSSTVNNSLLSISYEFLL